MPHRAKNLASSHRNGSVVGLIIGLFFVIFYFFVIRDTEIDDIKDQIVRNAIASYGTSCTCPFDLTTRGDKCGSHSRHSKAQAAGTEKPICFRSDVSDETAQIYRSR